MTYLTKQQARERARAKKLKDSIGMESYKYLSESAKNASTIGRFDVFLSHSIKDAEIVLGVADLLESRGKTVYIDWRNDTALDRENVTRDTAAQLKQRMAQCENLIYVATKNATNSKWMPWELGYFDGLKSGNVSVLPVVDYSNEDFQGQEYLSLYPKIDSQLTE